MADVKRRQIEMVRAREGGEDMKAYTFNKNLKLVEIDEDDLINSEDPQKAYYKMNRMEGETAFTTFYKNEDDDDYHAFFYINDKNRNNINTSTDSFNKIIGIPIEDGVFISKLKEITIINPERKNIDVSFKNFVDKYMSGKKFVIYKEEDLHPPNQIFQPKVEKLNDDEIKTLMSELGGPGSLKKLPKMIKTDSLVRYYNWEPGSIIMVTAIKPENTSYTDEYIEYFIVT
jgi:DNA-directed RNA polymerase subunit H (RpoH/RPB5)